MIVDVIPGQFPIQNIASCRGMGGGGSGLATENCPLPAHLWQWVIMQVAIISYKQLTPPVRGENYDL